MRLKRVDFPTFGRPMMATVGKRTSEWLETAEDKDIESCSKESLGPYHRIFLKDNLPRVLLACSIYSG